MIQINDKGERVNSLVVYSTKSGNSELIANSIAKELDCGIVNLNEVEFEDIDLNEIDTIFLGSGIYGGSFHRRIIDFGKFLNSNSLNRTIFLKIAFFITWLGRGKSDLTGIKHFKDILKVQRVDIEDDYFRCFGESFKFIRKCHPDKNDIENVKEWAKKMTVKRNDR